MKKLILLFTLLISGATIWAQHEEHGTPKQEGKQKAGAVKYTCPMHPEVQTNKPGTCPKCGMALVKQKTKVSKPAVKQKAALPKKAKAILPDKHDVRKQQPESKKAEKSKHGQALNQQSEKRDQTPGKRVVYHLYVRDTTVNFTGKLKPAIAINGSIPAPALYFTEGDTAEIYVHNTLNNETSIHWHGLILPNQFDGVPWLTQKPIKAGETKLYIFPIVQNGTYWYHSHTQLQEQVGMYGAFIIRKKVFSSSVRPEDRVTDFPLVLSEWTNERPHQVHRSLHNATDWYAIKKGATQSYGEAIKAGHFKTKVTNEWKRMMAMDVSDVYYDKFLINGKEDNFLTQVKRGDKIKLRIVNGGASTYFWLNYAGGKMTVVANDGEDVEPVEVDRLIIAVAETYDIILKIPDDGKSYELRATAEDRTKFTSLFLGNGVGQLAAGLPRLKYFEGMKMMNGMMNMDGSMDDMGMNMSLQQMDMNSVMYPEITGDDKADASKTDMNMNGHEGHRMAPSPSDNTTDDALVTLNYAMLRSPKKTTLPSAPTRTMHMELTGNMNRYVWTVDNKTVSEADKILIKKGDNFRIIMVNNSMMRHPMHLHGHFFRVLNGQGEYSPLKNVLDIMPMETDTIEFAATESGDWFFHCHILYHMMSGMGRIFSYVNSPPNPDFPDPVKAFRNLKKDDREFHSMAMIGLESNGSDGEAMLANTRWQLGTEWHLGMNSHHGYESETYLGRYFGKMQWLLPYIGFDYHYRKGDDIEYHEEEKNLFGQRSNQDNRKVAIAGIRYTLPMMVVADARVDQTGTLRFQLSREDIPLTPRLRFNFMGNSDREYMAGFRYVLTKYFSLSTHYDSDMGLGAGITITY